MVISAIKQAQQDRTEYDGNIQKEKDRWDEEDKGIERLEGIKREYAQIAAETQRKAQEQARYIQAYNAASQARQATGADELRGGSGRCGGRW